MMPQLMLPSHAGATGPLAPPAVVATIRVTCDFGPARINARARPGAPR